MVYEKEEYKQIEKFPDYYCSGIGSIVRLKNGKITRKKPYIWGMGYPMTKLSGKLTTVHRIVATTWLTPPSPEKIHVNHKNGIKTDNRVDNLEWVTQAENNRHRFFVLKKTNTGRKHK